MASPTYHRLRFTRWSRILLAVPLLAVLLGRYLYATEAEYPVLFWGALVLVVFFGVWAGAAAAWHYWVLSGLDAPAE